MEQYCCISWIYTPISPTYTAIYNWGIKKLIGVIK